VIGPSARVAHVGIAVTDIHEALGFYRDILGIDPEPETNADGAAIVSVRVGEVEIEFMRPTAHDGPVAKFLEKRGPGIHHISLEVPDLEAALSECQRYGYRLIDKKPRPGAGGRSVAFVHPKATGGVLLELTESS
jgi:methylmalonyl-CoA/ethylmalonyl-CoA epimerase